MNLNILTPTKWAPNDSAATQRHSTGRTTHIGGQTFDLQPLAQRICERYYQEFPDEHDRYEGAGVAWCHHDNQWLLSWAVDDVLGVVDLDQQAAWLARVLDARGFPLDRLARDLEIASVIASEGFGDYSEAIGARLMAAATGLLRDLRRREIAS